MPCFCPYAWMSAIMWISMLILWSASALCQIISLKVIQKCRMSSGAMQQLPARNWIKLGDRCPSGSSGGWSPSWTRRMSFFKLWAREMKCDMACNDTIVLVDTTHSKFWINGRIDPVAILLFVNHWCSIAVVLVVNRSCDRFRNLSLQWPMSLHHNPLTTTGKAKWSMVIIGG